MMLVAFQCRVSEKLPLVEFGVNGFSFGSIKWMRTSASCTHWCGLRQWYALWNVRPIGKFICATRLWFRAGQLGLVLH